MRPHADKTQIVFIYSIIKDMISNQTPATRALLSHPVIETFLDLKWSNVKYYFLGKKAPILS